MCGRYAMKLDPDDLKIAIEGVGLPVDEVKGPEKVRPSLNLAPRSYSMVYCSPKKKEHVLEAMQWTLQPSYAKEPVKYPSFNTRSESLSPLKPAWRCAKARRGIVFMDGYYEWQRQNGQKLPYYLHRPYGQLLAVLAVWDINQRLSETPTFSIVTTAASPDLAYIHARMPAVVGYEDALRWVEGEWPGVLDIVHPMPGLEPFRVGQDVNKVGIERPGLNERLNVKVESAAAKRIRPVTDWFAPTKRRRPDAGAGASDTAAAEPSAKTREGVRLLPPNIGSGSEPEA